MKISNGHEFIRCSLVGVDGVEVVVDAPYGFGILRGVARHGFQAKPEIVCFVRLTDRESISARHGRVKVAHMLHCCVLSVEAYPLAVISDRLVECFCLARIRGVSSISSRLALEQHIGFQDVRCVIGRSLIVERNLTRRSTCGAARSSKLVVAIPKWPSASGS